MGAPGADAHIWSLAVEEQFYFVWPLLFAALRRRRHIEKVAWLLVAASLILRVLMPAQAYGHTLQGRGSGILLGCAVALTVARSERVRAALAKPRTQSVIVVYTIAVLFALAVPYALGRATEAAIMLYGIPFIAVGFAALVSTLWLAPDTRVGAVLAARPLVYMGKISYGMYLYHMLAHFLVWGVLLQGIEGWNHWLKFGLRFSLFFGLTVALATISYFTWEKRFLALKERLR